MVFIVFDSEEFVKGKKVLVWGGMWKSERKDPKYICDFLQNHLELGPEIIRFVEQFRVFLAPLDGDRRLRERIESEIARSLNVQDGFVGSFQDKDVRYQLRRANEQQIKVAMVFSKPIMGMSEILLV